MSYDVSEAKEQEYELIPEGNYTATVVSAEKGMTSTGKEKVDIRYKLEEVNGILFDSPLVDFIQNTLEHFEVKSIEELPGKTAKIKCYHKEYQGKMYSKVGISRSLIPHNAIVKVHMKIMPGGLGEGEMETQSRNNEDNRYLKTLLTVIEGEYKGSTIFFNIMCVSKEAKTRNFGLSVMKKINIAAGLGLNEKAIPAQGLDEAIFSIKVGLVVDSYGKKNKVNQILEEADNSLGMTSSEPEVKADLEDQIPF